MARLALGLALTLAFALVTLAPARAQEKPAAEKPGHAETTEGLEKLFQDLLAAQKAGEGKKVEQLLGSLVVQDAAWFKKTFGDDKGAKVAEGYAKQSPMLVTELSKLVAECVKKEQTELKAIKLTDATDANATGLQKKALEAMKEKVALYTLKLTKKGEKSGLSLWSFAYVDGCFRLLGKMRELS